MTTTLHAGSLIWIAAVVLLAPLAQAGPRIGVLFKAKSGFWDSAEAGARKAGAEIEAELIVKAPQNETDIGVQIQMLNTLVEQGCEAIVISPSSKDALVAPVAAAVARGVKIVVIDTRLAGDVTPVFVGTDQLEAGRAAGLLVASLVEDGELVCLFRHNQTSGATEQREQGALEALRTARPGLVVHGTIYASSERGMETERANFLLNEKPEVKAILASGTPGTMAMLKVLRERGTQGKIRFVGFGYNINRNVMEAMESGVLDGWVAQVPSEMGAVAVRTAAALIKGEVVEPVTYTRFVVVTRANLRDPAVLESLAN